MAKSTGRMLVVLGAGASMGVVEALAGLAHGGLYVPGWNVALLMALGGLGGLLMALPGAALARLSQPRLPTVALAAITCAGLILISWGVGAVLPTWTAGTALPLWAGVLWLMLVPGLVRLPGPALRGGVLLGALLLQATLAIPADWLAPQPDDGPRLVLITVDGLRADRVDPDGPIGQLAARGRSYRHAYSVSPHAVPANLALLDRYLDGEVTYDLGCAPLLVDGALPAELHLQRHRGQAFLPSAGFVSSKLLSRKLHPHLGLGVHDDDFGLVQGLDRVLLGRLGLALRLWRPKERRDARYTVDAALGWLQDRSGPFVAWVHLDAPVGPYAPGDPWDKRFAPEGDPRAGPDRLAPARPLSAEHGDTLDDIHDPAWVIAQYEGEVAKVEHHVGRLLEALPDDVAIVLVGTHGESLGEAGRWFRHGSVRPVELHVPAIVVDPTTTGGVVVEAPVRTDQLADPTPRPSTDWRDHKMARPARVVPLTTAEPRRGPQVLSIARDEHGHAQALFLLGDRLVAVHERDGPLESATLAGEPVSPPPTNLQRMLLRRVSRCPSDASRPVPAEHLRALGGTPALDR